MQINTDNSDKEKRELKITEDMPENNESINDNE